MNVDQFVAKYNGVHIDEDGYYGAQCWDVVARYAREVVGCPSTPTGSGGAEGIFRLFQAPLPQYFDRIANDPNDPNQLPQKGDIIVWSAGFSPPYGHTALVISANQAGTTNLEQNGNNPGGAAYIKTRNWVGVSGWLRPKKGIDDMIDDNDVDILRIGHSEIGGWDFEATHNGSNDARYLGSWRGKPIRDFIRAQWVDKNAGIFRDNRIRAFKENPVLTAQVAELSKRPTQEEVDKLNLVKDELVKVQAIKDGVIANQTKEIESLKAQVGDNTKWETFKALIRELFTGKS